MAVIPVTGQVLETLYGRAHKAMWIEIGQGDTCDPAPNAQFSDRSVQAVGTWGGATLVMQGSNDGGTTWANLQDAEGNAISFTANDFKQLLEVSGHIRPSISGGDGTTDIDVHLVMVAR